MDKKIQIAICEDEQTQLEYMKRIILQWAKHEKCQCTVDGYISAEQLMFSFDTEFPYDIYFLDIEMGEMNGMELAREIRASDKKASIVFLTGVREYALEGYEVGAFRYLIKPMKEEDIYIILNELTKEKMQKEQNYFICEQRGELLKISYDEIWYLESQGHYVELSYQDCKVQWKAGFASLQKQFEENGFVLCRRGLLANVKRMARVGKTECVMDNDEILPISRGQYKKVNEAFIEYYRNGDNIG